MTLLRALSLPFQTTSLLFVALTATLLALVGSIGGSIAPLTIVSTYILLSWINKYAFALLDHAANGETQAPVASVEMLGPTGDWRAFVHPLLAALVSILAWWLNGFTPAWVALAALPLFPASVGALAISHHFLDAINPLALWRTVRDLGARYLVLLALMPGIAVVWVALLRMGLPRVVLYVAVELMVLAFYAAVGGALHERRIDLDFEPLRSPERQSQREAQEHARQRQAMLDAVYTSTHAGNYAEGPRRLKEWFESPAAQLEPDAHATTEQALAWQKDRAVAETLRVLVRHCVDVRQPAVALATAQAALRRIPAFAVASEAEATELARYASQTGRPGLARRLLDNFAATQPQTALSPETAALRASLDGR
jgi:hypothetical protein